MSVQDKKSKEGPRKLLARDGGGILGVMTLEVLAKMEGEGGRRGRVRSPHQLRALSEVKYSMTASRISSRWTRGS